MQIFGLTHSTQLPSTRNVYICIIFFGRNSFFLDDSHATWEKDFSHCRKLSSTLNFGMLLATEIGISMVEKTEGKSIEPSCDIYDRGGLREMFVGNSRSWLVLETLYGALLLNFGSIKTWMQEEESKSFFVLLRAPIIDHLTMERESLWKLTANSARLNARLAFKFEGRPHLSSIRKNDSRIVQWKSNGISTKVRSVRTFFRCTGDVARHPIDCNYKFICQAS